MVSRYFLSQFCKSFVGFFTGVICILLLGDLLVRLTMLPSLLMIPRIVILMFPLMSVFALPIGSALAVQVVLGKMLDHNEMLLVYYLPALKRKIFYLVILLTALSATVYIPLVFFWAPQSYFASKKLMVQFAKEKIIQLEPGKIHTFFSKFSLFFKKKELIRSEQGSDETKFLDFICFTTYQEKRLIVVAQEVFFDDDVLIIKNGTTYLNDTLRRVISTYERLAIDLSELWNYTNQDETLDKSTKYMNLYELLNAKDTLPAAALEMHIRYARILWQCLIGLLSIFMIFSFGISGESNLLRACAGSIFTVFVSYVNIGIVQGLQSHYNIALFILYGMIFCFYCVLYYLYRQRFP